MTDELTPIPAAATGKFNRRDFLRVGGLTTAAALITACGTTLPEITSTVVPTPGVKPAIATGIPLELDHLPNPDLQHLPTTLDSKIHEVEIDCANPNKSCVGSEGETFGHDVQLDPNEALVLKGDNVLVYQDFPSHKLLINTSVWCDHHTANILVNQGTEPVTFHVETLKQLYRHFYTAEDGWNPALLQNLRDTQLNWYLFPIEDAGPSWTDLNMGVFNGQTWQLDSRLVIATTTPGIQPTPHQRYCD